jgi:sortase (surface protein transpeptidase)
MEIGYDYLLMRSRLQQRFFKTSGIFLVVIGAILLAAGIAYFSYAYKANSDLDELNYAVTVPQTTSETMATNSALAVPDISNSTTPSDGGSVPRPGLPITAPESSQTLMVPQTEFIESSISPADFGETPILATATDPLGEALTGQESTVQISPSVIAAQQAYPGETLKAAYWSNPLEYEPPSYLETALLQGFRPIDSLTLPPTGTLSAAKRVILPSIGVDSKVEGLEIMNLGDSRAYQTPNRVVGQIPEESNPGEMGSVWLFGHLESPIAGEGNVFYNLPKIPDLLRKGQEVYTIVEAGSRSYLYKITEAVVVHQDDLKLDYGHLKGLKPEYAQLDPGGANLHLVACVPRFVYDSRLVVSGELVGVRS